MKETIKVETKDIKVGKRYYTFYYKVWRNGELIASDWYDSSHSRSPHTMRKLLKNGWATELILEGQYYIK